MVEPSSKTFDAALGFGAIRDLRGDLGELGALAAHDTADERGQRREVSGDMACGCAWIALYQGITYGTIPAKVVTHRLCLPVWFLSQDGIDDEPTSLKCPFHNGLGKCPVANSRNG